MEGTLNHSSMLDATHLNMSDEPSLPPLCPLQKDDLLLRKLEMAVPLGMKGIVVFFLYNIVW